jgi:DNA-cytosine methyltransferase
MNVLSLFDGMSCGRIAIDRAGIKVDNYFASEIDPYAEKISESNYPDIIRLGDITKWREWDIPTPDIILAGSPCQGFSFAGKGLNFNDPRSALFFVFADILRYYKPKYFLLENVKMKAEHQDVISGILGEIYPECVNQAEMFRTGRLEPVLINSALVSAQNRERLYWCNWKVSQPEDKGILLRDIIETGQTDREKSYCVDANYAKGGNEKSYLEHGRRQLIMKDTGKQKLIITGGAFRGRNPEKPTSHEAGLDTVQMLEMRGDEKTNTLTTVQKDNVCVMISNKICDLSDYRSDAPIHIEKDKFQCLRARAGGKTKGIGITTDSITWRKLSVTECERLQTVPDGFCRAVSKSRAYHALGNGWTVDVISHILKQMEIQK